MKRLTEVDASGDSLFRNGHLFYRDALKPGPQLDALTLRFLHYLQKELDAFDNIAHQTASIPTSLNTWSKTILGTASTNAMMGPSLLRAHPNLLPSVWLVETGFFLFVNKIPRLLAWKHYRARDHVLEAFTSYFEDERNKEGGERMIWEREAQLRQKGLSTRDVAAYSYSVYAVRILPFPYTCSHNHVFASGVRKSPTTPNLFPKPPLPPNRLLNNANPTAYWLLRRIYTHPNVLPKLRAEVAPAFPPGSKSITTLHQIHHLLTACPLLRAFYDETLRLHSYSSSNRIVAAPKAEDDTPITVGGYTLKQGHNLLLPSYAQHHSPHHFGPNPERFDPLRFLEPVLPGGKPADAKMVRAFGGGVSLCSGRFFAGNEVLAYAATVLWRHDVWSLGGGVCIVPRKWE